MSRPREVFGSSKKANWTIGDDPDVAPEHAALLADEDADDGLWIEDLGSGKPTLVDGERLEGRRRLLGTESVRIGSATITVSGLLPDGRVPEGSLFVLPAPDKEELSLEVKRNDAIETLSAEAAQSLAFVWSDRAARSHAAGALEAADLLDAASGVRGTPAIVDRKTSMEMDAVLQRQIGLVRLGLQARKDAGARGEPLVAGRVALHVLRMTHDAVRSALAPYSGSPGFAVMVGYGPESVPPEDTPAIREAHARPRAGVTGGRCVDAARLLDPHAALLEVRLQLKELLDLR